MTSWLRIGIGALRLALVLPTLLSSALLGACASSPDPLYDDQPIESQTQAIEEEAEEADWKGANR